MMAQPGPLISGYDPIPATSIVGGSVLDLLLSSRCCFTFKTSEAVWTSGVSSWAGHAGGGGGGGGCGGDDGGYGGGSCGRIASVFPSAHEECQSCVVILGRWSQNYISADMPFAFRGPRELISRLSCTSFVSCDSQAYGHGERGGKREERIKPLPSAWQGHSSKSAESPRGQGFFRVSSVLSPVRILTFPWLGLVCVVTSQPSTLTPPPTRPCRPCRQPPPYSLPSRPLPLPTCSLPWCCTESPCHPD